MFIIELIRYILGYINFKAYGGFADRFLNLCTREKIPVWNIKNVNGVIYASTTVQGYFALKKPAKKSGMKVSAIDKKGLCFFLRRNKSRVGIAVGTLAFIGVITVLSQFVWSVSVMGNETIDSDYLLTVFENHGVKVGAKISDIDAKSIAQTVVSEVENLSWAAVNRKGSVVVIEVRERTEAPEIYDDKTPTNLIASEDGVILSIDILNGKEEVKPGWAVTKGDLLVSGVITHADGTEVLVHADGYVKANVNKSAEFSDNDISLYAQTFEKTRKKVFFFGIEIPLGRSVPEAFFTEYKSFIKNDDLLLPLGIITEYGAEFSQERYVASDSLKNKVKLFQSACYMKNLTKYSEIEKSELEQVTTPDGTMYQCHATCKQEIGVLQEIYVEKSDDNT